MLPISSKSDLNRQLRNLVMEETDDDKRYPSTFLFCEGIGNPTFKITVQKVDDNTFIDSKGTKWIKQK